MRGGSFGSRLQPQFNYRLHRLACNGLAIQVMQKAIRKVLNDGKPRLISLGPRLQKTSHIHGGQTYLQGDQGPSSRMHTPNDP